MKKSISDYLYKELTITSLEEYAKLLDVAAMDKRRNYHQPFSHSRITNNREGSNVIISDFFGISDITITNNKLFEFSNSPVHSHDFYELAYVESGNYGTVIEDKSYSLSTGDLLLMNRNTKHSELNNYFSHSINVYLSFEEKYFEDYVAHFGNLFVKNGIIDRFIKNNAAKTFLNNKDYIIFKPIGDYSEVQRTFDEIGKVMRERPPYMQAEISYLIGKLFSEIENDKIYKKTYVDLGNFQHLKIAESVNEIIEQTRGNVTREEIAKILGYSENHVYRTFKKIYGHSVKTHCQLKQLEYAAELLSQTQSSISEIAIIVGLENRTQFYKLFKNNYGCTPKEYREKLGR